MTIKAFYDGKVFVPDEPLDLEANRSVFLDVYEENNHGPIKAAQGVSVFDWLIAHSAPKGSLPPDLGYQHDHYLYGTPKQDEQ